MKYLIALFVFACLASTIFGQSCADLKNCNACVANTTCGWCAPTWECKEGTPQGPNVGYCSGSAWNWNQCIDCNSISDCRTCLAYGSDCHWCANTTSCYAMGQVIGCPYAKSCPCNIYPDCSSCVIQSMGDCSWCGQDQTCRKLNDPTCLLPAHTCPCSDNPDCQACSATNGCHWCASTATCVRTSQSECPIPHTGCDSYCKVNGSAGCSACVNLRGCGWCSDTAECRDVDVAACQMTPTCANCGGYSYCSACSNDPGCNWCSNTKSCQPVRSVNCLVPHTCDNYCALQSSSCTACLSTPGCGWCDDSSTCVSSDTATCFLSHTCASQTVVVSKKGGFNAASFVGGMFLVIGILALALVAFFIYRWKVNQRANYTELK